MGTEDSYRAIEQIRVIDGGSLDEGRREMDTCERRWERQDVESA